MIQPSLMIIFEGTLSFALPIAWAVRELMLLNRPSPRGGPAAPSTWVPPLPPVLPARAPDRVRELEDA